MERKIRESAVNERKSGFESTAEDPNRQGKTQNRAFHFGCEERRRSMTETSKAVLGHAAISSRFAQDEI